MTRAVHGFSWGLKRSRTKPTVMPMKQQLWVAFFVIALLFTAFTVVYFKDLSRRLFNHYQSLQYQQQQSEEEWRSLLLEKGAWATQARVQHIAREELNMMVPKEKDVVIIER